MSKKYKFEIGEVVLAGCRAEMQFTIDEIQRSYTDEKELKIIRLASPIIGKICGMRRRFYGVVHPESPCTPSYYGGGDDYIPAYLEVKGSVLLYEIKEGMLNRPIEVLEKHITKIKDFSPGFLLNYQFPLLYTGITEKVKEYLRNESKNWPRDKKGRWVT
jgi:hypothetical protein